MSNELKPKIVVSKEAKLFYGMIAMFKCGLSISDYLCNTPEQSISPLVQDRLKTMRGKFNEILNSLTKRLDDKDRAAWLSEWDRDYESAGAIFSYWGEMTDEQRNALEEFAKQLHKGEVKIVHE